MSVPARPIVCVSRCLGFAKCRYDGTTIYDDFIEKLKPYVDYVTVCPEMEMGLGAPRDPIRVVQHKGKRRLIQPSTQCDVTDLMTVCANKILDSLGTVEGFILKSRSPSCGIKDTKYFTTMERSTTLGKGAGLFGDTVLARFPKHPVEDERRIRNLRIREHFLIRLFMLARFRSTSKNIRSLVKFHTEHKPLIMAYSQKGYTSLGDIVANRRRFPVDQGFSLYHEYLLNTLLKPARSASNITILMHELRYFPEKLVEIKDSRAEQNLAK